MYVFSYSLEPVDYVDGTKERRTGALGVWILNTGLAMFGIQISLYSFK